MATVKDRLETARRIARRSIRSLQKELHAAGVPGSSYANVHAYFRGKTEPPVDFLRAAGEALGFRPAWLAFEDGEPTWERQYTQALEGERGPLTGEEKAASDLFAAVMGAIEGLHVSGVAEDVLRYYYYRLLDHRDDVPTTMEGIASLLKRRFPLTVAASVILDLPSADVILFGEATAAYGVDFLAEARPPYESELESLRACAPPAPAEPKRKKSPKKKGGR